MKKTGKILLGVLSVGTIIGTAYATWHVSHGFESTNESLTPGIVTDVDSNFGKLNVTATDGQIKFGGTTDNEEDLHASYNVKATGIGKNNPYDLSNYENLATEYLPYLNVKVVVERDGHEVEPADKFFDYVEIPTFSKVDYNIWLKDADKGYDVNIDFKWSQKTFEGKNPEVYFFEKGIGASEAKNTINAMNSALNGVTFKFLFTVGNENGELPEPQVHETGKVTLPEVVGSKLNIDGLKDGKLTAGEHNITINIQEEGKVIKDSTLIINETIDKATTKHNVKLIANFKSTKTYSCTYNFKENATYAFEYALEDEKVVTEQGQIKFTVTENADVKFKHNEQLVNPNTNINIGETIKIEATPSSGYGITKITHNGVSLSLENPNFTMVKGDNIISITVVKKAIVPEVKYSQINLTADKNATVTFKDNGKIIEPNTNIEVGKEIAVEVKVNAGYELKTLTHNGSNITKTLKFTVLEGVNNVTVETKTKSIESFTTEENISIKEEESKKIEITVTPSDVIKTFTSQICTQEGVKLETSDVISLADNTVTGLKEGVAYVKITTNATNTVDQPLSKIITINVTKKEALPQQEVLATVDFGNPSIQIKNDIYTTKVNNEKLASYINEHSTDNSLIAVTSQTLISLGSNEKESGIKFAISSKAGLLDLKLTNQVSKVQLTIRGWNKDSQTILINNIKKTHKSSNGGVDTAFTLDFDLAGPSDTINIKSLERCVITKMVFYK